MWGLKVSGLDEGRKSSKFHSLDDEEDEQWSDVSCLSLVFT